MQIIYARVSTDYQTPGLHLDALTKAGCDRRFRPTPSGAKAVPTGLRDTLIVCRLDRRGRPLCNLIETIAGLHERGIGFRSLTESIDTTTSSGKLLFHTFGALAEFERDLIRERATGSLVAARARSRTGGWPKVQTFRTLRKLAAAQ